MGNEGIGTNKETERKQQFAGLERTSWALVWVLSCLLAAMPVAFVWVFARAHGLDADMDLLSAARGAG